MSAAADSREWLEADGLGGFASGPVDGPRTRRYHALLLAATTTGQRFVLVAGAEVVAHTRAGVFALWPQRFAGNVVSAGAEVLAFAGEPWPTWQLQLPDGTTLSQEILVGHGGGPTVLRWHLLEGPPLRLTVRPFFAGRDYHALHTENPVFDFVPVVNGDRCRFSPYPGVPAVVVASSGRFAPEPLWYRRFEYGEELARGFPGCEDLAAPGVFTLETTPAAPAVLLLAAAGPSVTPAEPAAGGAHAWAARVCADETVRRQAFAGPLERAADAYFVRPPGGAGLTVIAGYPWFTDWGRDTFIALRGLQLTAGGRDRAAEVLLRWAGEISEGMLPNRFRELGGAPEYNAVDAALWFVVVAFEFLTAGEASPSTRATLLAAIAAVVEGHLAGTRHGIAVGADGLLAAGGPGLQLTWMDAKVGDWVVTPRWGKPVEVQALWLSALGAAITLALPGAAAWRPLLARGRASFTGRFWAPDHGRLHDVVDVDGVPGTVDARMRPNQIFAVGGLPFSLLEGEQARAVVDAVEATLLVPVGLRSLAPHEPGYTPHYRGDPRARDGAYHQGTVWPWLLGPFVEAWLRVHGDAATATARARFFAPFSAHLGEAGVGHVSEIADGDAPHRPGGCPFQAWSLGELLRLERRVLRGGHGARPWPA